MSPSTSAPSRSGGSSVARSRSVRLTSVEPDRRRAISRAAVARRRDAGDRVDAIDRVGVRRAFRRERVEQSRDRRASFHPTRTAVTPGALPRQRRVRDVEKTLEIVERCRRAREQRRRTSRAVASSGRPRNVAQPVEQRREERRESTRLLLAPLRRQPSRSPDTAARRRAVHRERRRRAPPRC